jgi:branched-chain amino acid transport system substrate-binding protein
MESRKGKMLWMLLGLFAFGTTIGLGPGPNGAFAGEVAKLGVLMPVTGTLAYDGGLTIEGIKLAADEINAGGGIDGKMKIDLIVEDSAGLPATSVAAMTKLVSVHKVSAVIGDFASSCTLAAMEVAKRERVALVTPISLAPKITQSGNEWVFRACDNSEMIANAFTKYALKDKKIRKWAFIAVNTDYGRGSVDAFSKTIKALGGEIGLVEYFNQGETDYYTILTKLQATDTQGLCLLGETMDLSRVVNQFFELGLNKKMTLLDPTSGTFNSKFIELTKGRAEGMIGASRFVDTIETPAAKKFVAAYNARYGRVPEKYAQAGYDTVQMVAQAVARAKSTQPSAIRDALTNTQYEGPQGKAFFDKTNQLIIDEYIISVKGGKFVVEAGPIKAVD